MRPFPPIGSEIRNTLAIDIHGSIIRFVPAIAQDAEMETLAPILVMQSKALRTSRSCKPWLRAWRHLIRIPDYDDEIRRAWLLNPNVNGIRLLLEPLQAKDGLVFYVTWSKLPASP